MDPIRVGIVGAGGNTRLRHIPGFRAIDGVQLAGVVNRSTESSERAAKEFEIPKTYPDWQSLVDDGEIDAVMIGTWPNLHCDVTCAALAAGKHVLTEARMARNLEEALRMSEAARAHPNLVTQIVPSPFGLVQHNVIREMLDDGFLGELRELVVLGANDLFWDKNKPLHWRQDAEISGQNLLAMGILHEAALRFSPAPTHVYAQAKIFEPTRPDTANDSDSPVTVPDSVQVTTQLKGGGRGLYHLSGIALFGPGLQIHLYGSQGTIKLEVAPEERLLAGRAGDSELHEVAIPDEKRGGWRVEEEFICAIRDGQPVQFTDFDSGVLYMQFTDAVARSAKSGQLVEIEM